MSTHFNRIIKAIASIVLVTPMLTGCWDSKELENRAVILSIAIDTVHPDDKPKEPSTSHMEGIVPPPQEPLIHLTAQIGVPGRIPLGPGETGGGEGQKPVWIVDSFGHTIANALLNLQQSIADKIFLGHLRVIVVSDEFARTVGMANISEYLRRNAEVRRNAFMIISKGLAANVLRTAPELERVPALYLSSTISEARQLGKIPYGRVGDFWIAESSDGRESTAPYVEVLGQDNILVSGLTYFRGEKMVGYMTPFQIASFAEISAVQTGGLSVSVPVPGTNTSVLVRGIRRKTKVSMKLNNGNPYVSIKIHLDDLIDESSTKDIDFNNTQIIDKIQANLTKILTKSAYKLIAETKDKHSDIFGFGEELRAKFPNYWDSHVKTKQTWSEMYPLVKVSVQITSTIRRIQMSTGYGKDDFH